MPDTVEIIKISDITPEIVKRYSVFKIGKKAREQVYNDIQDLSRIYPGFDRWYNETVIPELGKTREILLAMLPKHIAGIAILKKAKEKKNCTFRVHADFTGQGIGHRLFEASFEYLEDKFPTFTVSSIQHKYFQPFIKRYRFRLVDELRDYYTKGLSELVFNHQMV